MLKFIEQFHVEQGQSKRFNCPNCGGKNTLSISNDRGKYKWYCFRASCNTRGAYQKGISLDSFLNHTEFTESKFEIPADWTLPLNDKCIWYLKFNNCWDAFRNGRANLKFDPHTNRICFIYECNSEMGAIGRALNKETFPKWYRYPRSTRYPFVCGKTSDTCVVVEDPASAVAVSGVYDGISLLGTNLTDESAEIIIKYKKAVICLDPDARMKSLKIQQELSLFMDTSIVYSDDLKYFKKDEIRRILNA